MAETKMTDAEAVQTLHDGWDLLLNYSRIIAMMPIEDWVEMLEKAEAIAPFVDPTLYRDALYSKKPQILKKIMRAALELKRTVEEVQTDVRAMMEKGL